MGGAQELLMDVKKLCEQGDEDTPAETPSRPMADTPPQRPEFAPSPQLTISPASNIR